MTDLESVLINLNRLSTGIQSEDRKKRILALKEMYSEFFTKNNFDDSDLHEIFLQFQKHVWKSLYDSSEAVRDGAINIVEELVNRLKPTEALIGELIPILLWRLGEKETNEPSEEVRLRLVVLLNNVILTYKDHCTAFTSDIVQILMKTLMDSYPKIRQESCKCAGNLAETVPRHFYDHSHKLIKPILSSFNHQHFRMRIAAIKALCKVVKWGNTKNLPSQEVFGSLAERLFDSTPAVRSAVTKVIGEWLISLYDRYSFFTKMIPLILTSLCDELPELREEAWELWSKAGLQYEQENEQDLKDKQDFLYEKPEHYPPNVERPNLGCRTLVQRNTCQITPALSRELEDWKNDIRIKSAQLLCWLVLHAETDITQHTENLLLVMYKVCNQTDARIVENVEKAAEYIAYFVPPESYMQLVVPIIKDVCTPGHLRVLSALIRGTKPDLLISHLKTIGELLSDDNLCRNRNTNYQIQLLKCCDALLTIGKEECSQIEESLFTVIITVKALSSQQRILEYAQELLVQLAKKSGYEDAIPLFKSHAENLLMKMHGSVETWTSVSYDRCILQLILEESGPVIGLHLSHIAEILKVAMRVDGDPLVRSKFFILMSSILCRRHLMLNLANEKVYQKFLITFIQDTICPNLVWHAGRTAEALRTVVAACLCSAILPQKDLAALFTDEQLEVNELNEEVCGLQFAEVETLEDVFKNLFPILINSAEDCAMKTRLFSLKSLQSLIMLARQKDMLTPDHVNQAYPMLLKRLDDVTDDVRNTAVQTLTILYSNLPISYHPNAFQPHLESLFTTMLIHLDDPNPDFQAIMIDALKAVGKLTPKTLHVKLNAIKNRFKNYKMCSELLEYLEKCYSQN